MQRHLYQTVGIFVLKILSLILNSRFVAVYSGNVTAAWMTYLLFKKVLEFD